MSVCPTCEYPARRLWTFHRHPAFVETRGEDGAEWATCPACAQPWCEVMYEPHAAFSFWAAWPGNMAQWQDLRGKAGGVPFHEWHEAVIVEDYATLPAGEQAAVEAWRRRAFGLTPIDHRRPRFCRLSVDLEKFIAP